MVESWQFSEWWKGERGGDHVSKHRSQRGSPCLVSWLSVVGGQGKEEDDSDKNKQDPVNPSPLSGLVSDPTAK